GRQLLGLIETHAPENAVDFLLLAFRMNRIVRGGLDLDRPRGLAAAPARSAGDLDRRAELGGIRWQNADDQAIPDKALGRTAKESRGHVERQPQEERPEDHPAGTNLDVVVVVVGAEETKQVKPANGSQ